MSQKCFSKSLKSHRGNVPWLKTKMFQFFQDYFDRKAISIDYFVTLGAQAYTSVANDFQVQGLPTLVVIHDGQTVAKRVGLVKRQELDELIHPSLTF